MGQGQCLGAAIFALHCISAFAPAEPLGEHPRLRGLVLPAGDADVAGPVPMLGDRFEAILRSLLAGLSTSLGAAVVLLLRGAPSAAQMAFALALAGGVMLTVSLLEMFMPELSRPERWPEGAFGIGLGFLSFMALKALVPEPHPHHAGGAHRRGKAIEEASAWDAEAAVIPGSRATKVRQWRLAVLLTLALTAHNFPEGLAVAVSSMQSDRLGFVVMAAIAVHNIPEGIAIAMPVIDATGNRLRALQMATLSGLAEPLGAIVAVALLPAGSTQGRGMDFLLCVVGGIMSCVAFTELLPEAHAQGRPMALAGGLFAGACVMLLTHNLA